MKGEEIVALRKKHIGRNLSYSPLHIVKGEGQYLIDEEGRRFLDLQNNVAHVGHCHPHVVRAAQRQLELLNTNTRYLGEHLVRYAKKLSDTFPDPLSVIFFVNSGSEANDLAQRLAFAHTKGSELLCVDVAYHGHLTSTIAISPYKYDAKGGTGPQGHVHKVLAPDVYRGPYTDTDAGRLYADDIKDKIQAFTACGKSLAAFFCESILGCTGQIPLPPGYLRSAYKHVRAAGGVCVADEVQVGFGRVGTHFWAFQTQGEDIIPDIVTLGKPIGNGFPMAAVVTTPEIAASFDNGMEYFNTFGGNPVSCAVGLAVLEVIEQENLMNNALEVGGYLMDGLKRLQHRHPLIGDVRGQGLFLGAELVTDRETKAPAYEEMSIVVAEMLKRNILIGTEGPYKNVIKMKPPMVFTRANADAVLLALDQILGDMPRLLQATRNEHGRPDRVFYRYYDQGKRPPHTMSRL